MESSRTQSSSSGGGGEGGLEAQPRKISETTSSKLSQMQRENALLEKSFWTNHEDHILKKRVRHGTPLVYD